jgi:hypothetical protein
MAYNKGYETGEPYGIAAMAAPMVGSALKPTSKMLAEMAHNQIMETGGIKLPMGLPEIPVANYAVKPKGFGGNWKTNYVPNVDPLIPLEKQGDIGKHLQTLLKTPMDAGDLWFNQLPMHTESQFQALLRDRNIKPMQFEVPEFKTAMDDFVQAYNAKNPNAPIKSLQDYQKIVDAYNQFISAQYHKYLTNQFATGAETDPALRLIEQYNLPITNKETPQFVEESGERARHHALDELNSAKANIESRQPIFPNRKFATPLDLTQPQNKNIGQQTAVTPHGINYENTTDAMVWPSYSYEAGLEKNLPHGTPTYDLHAMESIGTYSGLPEIRQELFNQLLSGKIAPENIANVSVERIVKDILEGKKAVQKALQKNKEAYAGWRIKRHQELPVDGAYEDGSKMVVFNQQNSPNKEILARDLSVDTKDLNHCLAHSGHNQCTGYEGRYAPYVEPHTGVHPQGSKPDLGETYIRRILDGQAEIASLRDPKGEARATLELKPSSRDGKFDVHQLMGPNDRAVIPEYRDHVRGWLSAKDKEGKLGFVNYNENLPGIIDLKGHDAAHRLQDAMDVMYNEEGLINLRKAMDNDPQFPRFATEDEIRNFAREKNIDLNPAESVEYTSKYPKGAAAWLRDAIDYFEPGAVRKSYAGHDRIISFDPETMQVKVQAVQRNRLTGEWEIDPRYPRPRVHMTMPDERDIRKELGREPRR